MGEQQQWHWKKRKEKGCGIYCEVESCKCLRTLQFCCCAIDSRRIDCDVKLFSGIVILRGFAIQESTTISTEINRCLCQMLHDFSRCPPIV